MLVRDKMTTPVITINLSDSLVKAEMLMQQHNFHHLPVLGGRSLVGIISASDLEAARQNTSKPFDQFTLADIVPENQRIVTTQPDVSIEQATMLMQNNKIGSLPVLENGSNMVGIITLSDILNTFLDLFWAKRGRLEIQIGPEPGLLADITTLIGSFEIPILRIAMFPIAGTDSYEAMISLDTDDIKPVIDLLRAKGYSVKES